MISPLFSYGFKKIPGLGSPVNSENIF